MSLLGLEIGERLGAKTPGPRRAPEGLGLIGIGVAVAAGIL